MSEDKRTPSLPITRTGSGEHFGEVYFMSIQQNCFRIADFLSVCTIQIDRSIHVRCDDRSGELSDHPGIAEAFVS